MCDAIKQIVVVKDLMSLAIGPLEDLGATGDAIQKRGPGQPVVPRTTDCKVHRTEYKGRSGYDISYYCEMSDADPRGSDHKRIMRDLNARLRPCMAGWSEREDFNESKDRSLAFLDTYSVNYIKGGRKVAIICLTLLDDPKAYNTTFNVVDKFDR